MWRNCNLLYCLGELETATMEKTQELMERCTERALAKAGLQMRPASPETKKIVKETLLAERWVAKGRCLIVQKGLEEMDTRNRAAENYER